MHTIESLAPHNALAKHRLVIKGFKTTDDMHRFLNKADNSLRYRISDKSLKPGTYAFAGGQWHNVKSLDASILAHI